MKRILLPVDNNLDLYGLCDGNNDKGFVNTNVSIHDIANRLTEDGGENHDHAIPSPVSYLQFYIEKIRRMALMAGTNDIDHAEDYFEWMGMLAILALQNVYGGYKVTFDSVSLQTSFLGRAYAETLECDADFVEPGHTLGQLVVMRVNDTPIAVTNKTTCLCPFKEYDRSALQDVQWYHHDQDNPGNDYWKDLREVLDEDGDDRTLSSIASYFVRWLNEQNNQNPFIKINVIKDYICNGKALEANVAKQNLQLAGNIEALPAALGMTANDLQGIEFPNPIGEAVFTDKIAVINVGNGRRDAIKSLFTGSIDAKTNNGDILYQTFLPPISGELCRRHLDTQDTFEIIDIAYESGLELVNQTKFIKVTLKYRLNDVLVSRTRRYEEADILYFVTFPYISLWPNVKFNNADQWHFYQLGIFKTDMIQSDPQLLNDVLRNNVPDQEAPEFVFKVFNNGGNPVDETAITTKMPNMPEIQPWKVYDSNQAIQYMTLAYKPAPHAETVYGCGAIIIDQTSAVEQGQGGNGVYKVGLDFGTTNTNCYYKSPGQADAKAVPPSSKYLLNVTNPPSAGRASDISNFCWVGGQNMSSKNSKIFTAAQYYGEPNIAVNDLQPYVHGKIIDLNQNVLNKFAKWENSMNYYGIYLNLKFDCADNEQMARIIFIEQLMINALLKGRIENANDFEIYISYPYEAVFDGVRDDWENTIKEKLGAVVGDPDLIGIYRMTEAAAVGNYFPNQIAGMPYGIIDIGGGTSDFSFWKQENGTNTMFASASFKYAGNKLISRSLYQVFYRSKNKNKLLKLWKNQENAAPLIEQFYEKIKNYKMSLDITLNDPNYLEIQHLLNVLLEKESVNFTQFNTTKDYQLLRIILRLRYTFIFYLYASLMHEKLPDEIKGDGFTIIMVGGGSNGLKFAAGNENLANFAGTKFGKFVVQLVSQVSGVKAVTFNISVTSNKEEVVKGLLVDNLPQGIAVSLEPNEAGVQDETAASEDIETEAFKASQEIESFLKRLESERALFKLNDNVNLLDKLKAVIDDDKDNAELNRLSNRMKQRLIGENAMADTINAHKAVLKECHTVLVLDKLIGDILENIER